MTEIPSDLDWVAKRHACNVHEMFERLRARVASDVNTRKGQFSRQADYYLQLIGDPGTSYISVVFRNNLDLETRVSFGRKNNEIIVTKNDEPVMTATLTLTDDGTCKFKVGADELHPWQLSRRVLEPVLFG